MSLRITNLKKNYVAPDGTAAPVIDIADLMIGDGEQVALIGTSGSGKTTLLHLIAGILAADSGRIIFEDSARPAAPASTPPPPPPPAAIAAASPPAVAAARAADPSPGDRRQDARAIAAAPPLDYSPDPVRLSPPVTVDVVSLSEAQRDVFRGRYIGYIFQTHHLLPGFTALENVVLGMSFTGRLPDSDWARHLLRQVGLGDRLAYKAQRLSLGQQQRVAVARALANRPRLVLADEPTGSLDARNAQQVLELIRRLCAEVGASLLLVSHDLAIANQLPRVLSLAEINRACAAPVTQGA